MPIDTVFFRRVAQGLFARKLPSFVILVGVLVLSTGYAAKADGVDIVLRHLSGRSIKPTTPQ